MPPRAILYARASTRQQANSGLGLEAQWAQLEAEASRRGWEVAARLEDPGVSAAKRNPPGVQRALELLEAGDADLVAVAKLDRLARSFQHAADIIALGHQQKWALVCLAPPIDTTTRDGRMFARLLATLAEWEREFISDRTREALAARRARGERLGRRSAVSPELAARILQAQQAGMSLRGIARMLNDADVPTLGGGAEWRESSIRSALRTIALERVEQP